MIILYRSLSCCLLHHRWRNFQRYGADCWTDHVLLRCKARFAVHKPVRKKPSCIKRKFDVSRLKCTGIQSELQEKLCELLPALPVDTDTAEHAWTVFRDAVFSAAETALGLCKRKHQDWFDQNDQDILTLIEVKHSAHAAWLSDKNSASKHAHFKQLLGQLQSRTRELKNAWWADKATEVQNHADNKRSKEFYPSSALFSAQRPRFETRMACSSLTKRPLWVIKWVCQLIYTHTKPGGRLKWSYAKSPGWQPTLYVAWCLICWLALAYKKYGHTWHRMSLLRPGVIKQHKPNQTSLTKRTSWSNGPFTSVPCSTGPQKWPMKHWSPFSNAPWSQNLMPHLTQQRLMQPSNSCKQARLRDQMEYQPRCSKPVVKPLSLTLPGCSKCSGSMASSHGTSGMPTSSTCTKTRVIAHPATTTTGSASSALQARYWPVSCWTGSPSTYWMMLCLRASVASESRGAWWIWSLLSGSSRKNVSSSTKTSTCSSSISQRHSTLWTELHSGRYSASLDAQVDLYRSSAPSMMACFCRVIENGDASDPFPVSNGVKQCCVLAPMLFSLLFVQMLSAALSQTEAGVKIHYRTDGDFFNLRRLKSYTKVTRAIVRDFLFADDCALAAHSEVDLQELADCFATAAKSFGLTVSIKKTEVLRQLAPNTARPPPNITMDGNVLKNVDTFKYLGSCINSAANLDDEVLCRISRASQAFGRLHTRVWHERGISIKTKLSIYRAVVLPSLLYSCETWTCYRRHTEKLDQFHLRCLRKVLRVSWKEHVPNQEILRWAELTGIEAMLNQAQLRWSGHVTRMDDSRLPKQLFHAELSTGKRHKGEQRKRYKDVLKSTLKACNIPVDEWQALAQDRPAWRAATRKGTKHFERSRLQSLDDKRSARKNRVPNPSTAVPCQLCGKICASTFGLQAHMRKHQHWRVIFVFEGLLLLL